MNRNLLRGLLPALALAFSAGACLAQTLYLFPEPPRPLPGEEIRVRLMSGTPFAASATVDDLPQARLHRLWRSGRQLLEPAGGAGVPVFSAAEPGVQLLSYRNVIHDEAVESFGKALLVVGDDAAGERIWRSELGHRLEIVPGTDPALVAERGGPIEVQVLLEREPLVGVTVVALAEGAVAESYTQALTDASGRVRFDLTRPGRWLIHLAHKSREAPAAGAGEARWLLLQSSLLLLAGPQ